jgi:AraC family transcriptional regulator of arabinose operon
MATTTGLHVSSAAYPYRLQLALRLLAQQCHNPRLTLDSLAVQVRVTPGHLSRLFVRTTGEGFAHHLRRARLEHARRLLETTALNVKEIAAAAGYKHVSELDRHFRKTFGGTPTAHRVAALAAIAARD